MLQSALGLLAQYGEELYYTTSSVDGDAAIAGLFGMGYLAVWLICCCLWVVIELALAYVVYRDAKKNNVDNPLLWGIITFFFTVPALIIYFVAIKPKQTGTPVTRPEQKE